MRLVVHFTSQPPFPPGKEPSVPIAKEVGWTPEPVWTLWSREKSLCPCQELNPRRPARSPLLYRLSYHSSCKKEIKLKLQMAAVDVRTATRNVVRTKDLLPSVH
jgi:hypothetical protein